MVGILDFDVDVLFVQQFYDYLLDCDEYYSEGQ